MEYKYALLIETTDESIIDIWQQLVSTRVSAMNLFDHDEDILIFSTQEECNAALSAIEALGLPSPEIIQLLLFPDSADKRKEFGDYGFISHLNHPYVYASDAYMFILNEEGQPMQAKLALEQMEEHLLASFEHEGKLCLAASNHSDELMRRIARAYRCSLTAIDI